MMKKFVLSLLVLTAVLPAAEAQETSVLWGVNGEAWNTNGLLRDFTADAGYMGGNVPIPDWPVWTNLTDMGAVVDDRGSDVAVLREAISNCPPYHAIFLPNGTYMIDEQIILDAADDNIVIRGESRDRTILYFPKHMNEIQEVLTSDDPFITFAGGTNRGIENLSLVLRDERKGVGYVDRHLPKQNALHWWYNGEVPILFGDQENNSWMRNVYIRNGNHPIRIKKATHITVMNIVLDNFVGRADPDQGGGVGHMGIYIGDSSHNCLIHNILMTGSYVHDICPMGVTDSVFSRISGPAVRLDHHAMGNQRNLYTEVDYGITGDLYGTINNNEFETYWSLNGINDVDYLPTDRSSVIVGIKTSQPTSIGATWHHETLDPNALTPTNLYLAQMAYHNKTNAPADMTLTLPVIGPGVPAKISVLADTSVGESGTTRPYGDLEVYSGSSSEDVVSFLKFDLSRISTTSVSNAILRIYCSSDSSFPLTLQEVSDDSWTEADMTWANRPAAGDSIQTNASGSGWIEWDITATVNQELAAADDTLSLCLQDLTGSGIEGWFKSKETPAYVPHLVIGVDKVRPAPPATPTGLGAVLDGEKVILDWDDNPETHTLTYNVYRNVNGEGYKLDAMGLRWSDYENASVDDGSRYFYKVSAVDAWGQESPQSDVIAATIGGEVSNLPLFTTHPVVESNAKEGVPYTATLADNALNPEPYEMTYSLLSTPTWLNVASSGALTGTPTAGDVGTNSFTVKLEAQNGSDTNTLKITVLSASLTNVFINGSGDGLFEDGVNWSTGLPSVSNNVGYIDVDCKYSINDRNTYYIIHRAGAIHSSGVGADPKLVGGTFAQNGGTWGYSGGRGFDMDSGNITTLNGGAIYGGSKGNSDIRGGSTLIINSGSFEQFGSRSISIHSSTLTVNGGTLAAAHPIQSSSGQLNFNGGTITATILSLDENSNVRFGGTSTGSVTVATLTAGTVDWRTGTKMSLAVTNTADWAQTLWDAGALTYNGNGTNELNKTWAEVTTADGLEAGVHFDYDSATETLSLVSDVILSGYGAWAAGWSNNIGAATNDFDSDGLNNLVEYAMDGNPTNGLVPTNLPLFTKSGSGFLYIHPQRSDDPNLIYTVETTTNLMDSGAWTNEGYTVTGTNVTGGPLDFVTNDVATVENKNFIRLKIEQ